MGNPNIRRESYGFDTTSAGGPPGPRTNLDRQIYADIRDSGRLYVGPALNPADIGPAINAAFTAGYTGIYIPPRFAFDGGFAWGCTTAVSKSSATGVSWAIIGCPSGGTLIQLVEGQVTPFTLGTNDGDVTYRDLTFIGTAGNNLVCPNVIGAGAARVAKFIDCNFWGCVGNADGTLGGGVLFSRGDLTVVERCSFYGCDYRGTAQKGGVVSSTGMEDGFAMRDCRFFASGVLNGVTYNKTSATQTWLWLGGQGEGGATRPGTYVRCSIEDTWFASVTLAAIQLQPEGPTAGPPPHLQFILLHVAILGCGITTPAAGNYAIDSNFCTNLHVEDTDFYGSPTTVALKIQNADTLVWKKNTLGNGQKNILFGTAVGYVEIDQPSTSLFLDDTAFAPTRGIVWHNTFQTIEYPGPHGIPGLMLWLDSRQGVAVTATKVTQWNDRSGVGDANRNVAQAVAANQPTYNTGNASYGGLPTIDFTTAGAPKFLQSGNWSAAPPNEGTLVVVGNFDNTATAEIMICDNAANKFELYQNGANDLHFLGAADIGAAGTTPRLDLPHMWIITLNVAGGLARIRQDSTAMPATSAGNVGLSNPGTAQNTGATNATGMTVGAQAGGTNGLIGSVCQVLVYDHILTVPEVALIGRWASSLAELPVGP